MTDPRSLTGAAAPLAQAQLQALVDDVVLLVLLGVACALVAGAVGGVHRWYARTQVPDGLSILAGISVVAIGLNTKAALGDANAIDVDTALANVGTFLAATVVAFLAGRAGDRIARTVFDDAPDARDIVRAMGRQITVTLPQHIDDIPEHDPVDPETKTRLEGTSFGFPRRLTVEELRRRLVERLKSDYEVGHVDVDLTPDGAVEYLALGGRAAGIGPTLPPGQAAVAIRADPSSAASAGDLIQVWDPPERVVTGELRGVAGDVSTVVLDDDDAETVDGETTYRLVTLPSQARVDREFAALFRAADETLAVLAVEEGSALVGQSVGSLAAAVVAVRGADGAVATLPDQDRPVAAGESLFVVGRPDVIRKLEATDGVATPSTSRDRATSASTEQVLLRGGGSSGMRWKLFANLAETAGEREVPVDVEPGATLRDALDALFERHPDLREEVTDEEGTLYDHVRVLRNSTDPFVDGSGYETTLEEGDELAMFPPVSGG